MKFRFLTMKIPADKQDIFLIAMDAFVIGAEAMMQLSAQDGGHNRAGI